MAATAPHPMVPRLHRVRGRWRENHDTVTISLEPLEAGAVGHQPGQFNMLYRFGIGEVPISVSSHHRRGRPMLHTIRAVGAVSTALCRAKPGEIVGVRGPFGTGWGIDQAEGADLVLVAGGIGLAPLRSALRYALAKRRHFGRLVLLVGARSPDEMVFRRELDRLAARPDVVAAITVDRAGAGWRHHVGVVTQLVPAAPFDPASAVALVCGPEVMMRFTATALLGRGMPAERIRLSLERNMRCAIGWCGHCQLGSEFVCKNGPVRSWDQAAPILAVKER
jgi:NAD(P)H-flavin reductase